MKQHAEDDGLSMNSWVQALLDREDMRRRCAAHERWMANNPDARATAEQIADQAADVVARR